MHIPKLSNGCARDSPKEVGDSQKLSEVKVDPNEHEWDNLRANNYNSFAASRYLKQISFAERFKKKIRGCITNSSKLHTFHRTFSVLFISKRDCIARLDATGYVYHLYSYGKLSYSCLFRPTFTPENI